MKTILVIDDDPGIVEVLSIILQQHNYQVIATEAVETIAEQIKTNTPDLIILDIWISGADGRDVFRNLKQLPDLQKTPILIMSAKNDAPEISKQLGADGLIPKPFDIDVLLQTVSKSIRSR